jgi:hypothetical protein
MYVEGGGRRPAGRSKCLPKKEIGWRPAERSIAPYKKKKVKKEGRCPAGHSKGLP